MINDLKDKFAPYSIKIKEEHMNFLKKFYIILKEANKEINLISRKNFDKTFLALTFQSIWVAEKLGQFNSFIDVGSGGGFPAVPIMIYKPRLKAFLIEPRKKKANF